MGRRVVSVFGGSSPRPGSPAYEEAYTLGGLLARAGYTVMNGGYSGTMEAVSRGAAEQGGDVIGVTVGLFARYGLAPNRWVTEEVRFETLQARLLHLVSACDGVVALRGGVGTLSEVAMTWSLLQVGEITPRPFVLVGAGWARVLETYRAESYINADRDLALVQVVQTAEEAPPALAAWFANPPEVPLRLSGG